MSTTTTTSDPQKRTSHVASLKQAISQKKSAVLARSMSGLTKESMVNGIDRTALGNKEGGYFSYKEADCPRVVYRSCATATLVLDKEEYAVVVCVRPKSAVVEIGVLYSKRDPKKELHINTCREVFTTFNKACGCHIVEELPVLPYGSENKDSEIPRSCLRSDLGYKRDVELTSPMDCVYFHVPISILKSTKIETRVVFGTTETIDKIETTSEWWKENAVPHGTLFVLTDNASNHLSKTRFDTFEPAAHLDYDIKKLIDPLNKDVVKPRVWKFDSMKSALNQIAFISVIQFPPAVTTSPKRKSDDDMVVETKTDDKPAETPDSSSRSLKKQRTEKPSSSPMLTSVPSTHSSPSKPPSIALPDQQQQQQQQQQTHQTSNGGPEWSVSTAYLKRSRAMEDEIKSLKDELEAEKTESIRRVATAHTSRNECLAELRTEHQDKTEALKTHYEQLLADQQKEHKRQLDEQKTEYDKLLKAALDAKDKAEAELKKLTVEADELQDKLKVAESELTEAVTGKNRANEQLDKAVREKLRVVQAAKHLVKLATGESDVPVDVVVPVQSSSSSSSSSRPRKYVDSDGNDLADV